MTKESKNIGEMKNLGPAIAWGLNRFVKVFGNLFSLACGGFTQVKKGRVMCWAYNFKQYSCNPRYLTEYLLKNNPEFEIYWVFRKKVDISGIDSRIKCVRFRSLEYYKLVNSAEFFITNSRTDPYRIYWHKRPGQKYLMLWHGGVALKKIEKDAEAKLGYSYVQKSKIDSKVCDLMTSSCRYQTDLMENKFWYSGEILKKGIPRNDIFFDMEQRASLNAKVRKLYSISSGDKIVMYAPTFRRGNDLSPYSINWDKVIPELEKVFGGVQVRVLVRLHPNLIGKVDTSGLVAYEKVTDATLYHDMQELLCVSDMLITDYSSAMFDFAMLERPCLLYATDIEKYDRGYYFRFDELPFPLARTQEDLLSNLASFDRSGYDNRVTTFFDTNIGIYDDGHASEAIAEWMISRSIS